jgi:hypothetical protein
MVTLNGLFLIVALVLFVVAALNVTVTKVNLLAAGLAFWVASSLLSLWRG